MIHPILFSIVLIILFPEFSRQQSNEDSSPLPSSSSTRFGLGSRPTAPSMTSSSPQVILDIEKQLESINAQREKLEQMKMKLVQQLDTFRDEYIESLKSTTSTPSKTIGTTSSILLSTLTPSSSSTTSTSTSDATNNNLSSRLVEIKDVYMEVQVKSPLVIINRPDYDARTSQPLARS